MRPLIEMLEDERELMLKQDTIFHNMERYPSVDAQDILLSRKETVNRDLQNVRNEIREYFAEIFK